MTDKIPGYLKALYEREPVRVLFFYTLLIFLFYSPVVFTGKTLQPPLYQPHGVLDGWAGEGRRPVNSFNVDLATPSYYEWPVNKLVGDFYRKGELPLWNPYQGAGIPLAAQYSTRAFFPYQVLEDMSPVWTWDFFILARLLVAGFLTYLFLSALGLSFPSAFLGGMLYMFSGTFVWFINLEQMANTAMMLPLVMYMVELLARKKGSVYIPAASFSFALLLLAGQPEVALYATLLSFSYFIFRVFTLHGYPGFLRPATRFIPAFLLGLGISAPLILPFLELVGVGHHIHTLGGPMGSQALMSWQTIYAIFTPSATVFPSDPEMVEGLTPLVQIDGGFYRFLPTNGLWDSLGGYTGVLSVYLAVVGFLLAISANKGRLRGVSLFFIIFATSIILKNIGIRPFIWLGNLPLFDQVWSLRWAGPVWTFAISMAGAIGLEVILRSTTGGKTGTGDPQVPGNISAYFDEKPYMAAVFSFILLFGLYVSLPLLPSVVLVVKRAELFNANMAPFVLPSILGGTLVALLVLTFGFLAVFYLLKNKKGAYAVLALGALELWWAVPRGYGPAWMSFKWVPFLVGLVIVILFLMERRRVAFSAVLVFFAAVLIIDSTSPRGLPEKSDPFDPSRRAPYVEFLKTRPGNYRSVGSYGVLFPNFASSLGIMDLRYVNSITPSTYHDFRTMYLHKDPIQEEGR
jgi:hypothetical protein